MASLSGNLLPDLVGGLGVNANLPVGAGDGAPTTFPTPLIGDLIVNPGETTTTNPTSGSASAAGNAAGLSLPNLSNGLNLTELGLHLGQNSAGQISADGSASGSEATLNLDIPGLIGELPNLLPPEGLLAPLPPLLPLPPPLGPEQPTDGPNPGPESPTGPPESAGPMGPSGPTTNPVIDFLANLPASGAGSTVTSLPMADVYTAYKNIFRTTVIPSDIMTQLNVLKTMVDGGVITQKTAILQIVHSAAPYTGLAEAAYQFFTGRTPSEAGLDYLTNSVTNPTDLTDSYYSGFNIENRYINFASNLGLHGEGAPTFIRDFGSLTFEQAVAKAYTTIIGLEATTNGGFSSSGAVADIVSRKAFFEQVAAERFGNVDHAMATKVAAIGYLLQESVRAGVGLYGDSVENLLFDLNDGVAQHHIDLIGVYGPNSMYNVD